MISVKNSGNYRALKEHALSSGAALFGVCRTDSLKKEFSELSREALAGLDYAVSLGVPLSGKIVDGIEDHPTKLYFYHYKQVNYLLDRLSLQVTKFIQEKNYSALPIPASQVIDREKQRGHLSHREAAALAGLGWIGRSCLLVTPGYGARVRLVTVLTDFPLSADKALKKSCANCRRCITACPAGAIRGKSEEFGRDRCFRQLDIFRNKYGIGHHICGLCVKACRGKGV